MRTHNLDIDLMAPAQAQKHVTYNEAITRLDRLVQIKAISTGLNSPPIDPQNGDQYIVAQNAQGAWVDHGGCLAVYDFGSWQFIEPRAGWVAWDLDTEALYVFNGSEWTPVSENISDASLSQLGINTPPDIENRLSVSANQILLSHDGADCRLAINKSLETHSASTIFQDNFQGYAEIGLTGDNDFHVKISSGDDVWQDAMRIDTQTGDVNFDSKISCHEGAIVNINRPANIFNPALTIQNDNAGTQGYAMIKCARTDGNNGIKSVAFGMNALGNNNYGGEDTLILGSFLHDVNISLVTSNATRLLIQKTTGHVGVGTTSPSCKLHVNGPVRIGTYAADNLPSASECGLGAIICISNYDEGSGPSARLALSDGSEWQALS